MKKFMLTFYVVAIFVGCEPKLTSEKLIDATIREISNAPDTIINFETKADCRGPLGDYTTEVNSGVNDYTYFKQLYTYRDSPFEAVIISADSGFHILNNDSTKALDKTSISIIRGHEFHKILLDIRKRYHGFSAPEELTEGSIKLYAVKALDDLNNPVSIHIERDTHRISALVFANPGDTSELITVSYSDWRQVQSIKLPMRVTIRQGKEKDFSFVYSSAKINSKTFRRWSANKN